MSNKLTPELSTQLKDELISLCVRYDLIGFVAVFAATDWSSATIFGEGPGYKEGVMPFLSDQISDILTKHGGVETLKVRGLSKPPTFGKTEKN